MTNPSKTLRVAVMATATLALSTVTALGATPAGAATVPHFSYQGSGYGTTAQVGTVVTSGRSALTTLGCTDEAGVHHANSAAGVNLAPLLTSGTVRVTTDSLASPVRSHTTATTQRVNLLNGLVRGDAVKAVSTTAYQSGRFAVSAVGTNVVNLMVAGVSITAVPAPNTRINLAGIGYLILNQQTSTMTATSASLTVNALHLYVTTTNSLGIAPNTSVIVSSASSGLTGPVAGVLDGHSYGSSVSGLGNIVNAGRSFPETMPCLGTGGITRTNSGASVAISGVFSNQTVADTVRGTVTATSASGETTSTVQSAYVLSSLVHATGIKADAHASTNGSSFAFSDTGSRFATLTIRGFAAVNANVAPNSRLFVAGVGTLYLHRVIRTANSIEVRMIELILTSPVNGLPIGTDIRVAVAEASAH